MIQRSFADLLPSEKATVMGMQYDKMRCQGKRNDIIRELQILNGETPAATCGHNGHRFKTRDTVAEEYGYSSRSAARYLRINNLIHPFKDLVDDNKIALLAAVDVSYLSEEEQEIVYKVIDTMGVKLKPKMADELRKHGGELTEDAVESLIDSMTVRNTSAGDGVKVVLSDSIRERYLAE